MYVVFMDVVRKRNGPSSRCFYKSAFTRSSLCVSVQMTAYDINRASPSSSLL